MFEPEFDDNSLPVSVPWKATEAEILAAARAQYTPEQLQRGNIVAMYPFENLLAELERIYEEEGLGRKPPPEDESE